MNFHLMRRCARKSLCIQRLHPLSKAIVTMLYMMLLMSIGQYDLTHLMGFLVYPIVICILAELPIRKIFSYGLVTMPFVMGVGLSHLWIDHTFYIELGNFSVSSGMICFLTLTLKGILAITGSLIFMMTTPIEAFMGALEKCKVPSILLALFFLTYRYIYLLVEETQTMYTAYKLRAPKQKGIHYLAWGTFLGQILLRTYQRGNRLYETMLLRGFDGTLHFTWEKRFKVKDFLYVVGWSSYLLFISRWNLPELLAKIYLEYLS